MHGYKWLINCTRTRTAVAGAAGAMDESEEIGGGATSGSGDDNGVRGDTLVPRRFQHMLCFSGLRGAIAFALALKAREAYSKRPDGSEGAGDAILTTTMVIILFSVLVLGGLTATVMEHLVPSSPAHSPRRCREESARLPPFDSFEDGDDDDDDDDDDDYGCVSI